MTQCSIRVHYKGSLLYLTNTIFHLLSLLQFSVSAFNSLYYNCYQDITHHVPRRCSHVYSSKDITLNQNITLIHSFHWHVQNATIPCRSHELLPFPSVIYHFLPPFSTNQSSILPHIILPSISWSTFQLCCFQIDI